MCRTLVFVFLLVTEISLAQRVHPNAHAHNDYEHPRPLINALENGFCSIEVDIHLINEFLYVSHDRPRPGNAITLEALYLDPLDSLLRHNLIQSSLPLTLLIDIKTNGARTLEKLIQLIQQYPRLVQPNTTPPVRFVISGNRDYQLILKIALVSIDGRPSDLGKGYSRDKMPLISDHFGNWMHWNGKGKPAASEMQKVRELAKRVHAENRLLRLWAIPDREEAWEVLLEAGVDLINTDRLEALNQFLSRRH